MKKRIIIISGFSGVGKSSVIHRVMDIEKAIFKEQSRIWFSVSDTTRAARNKDDTYTFISKRDYQSRVNDDGYYLEYNFYNGNGYGTPRKPVFDVLEKGGTVILEIDRNGMEQVLRDKELRDTETVTVFLCASADILKFRLLHRGDSKDETSKRIAIANNELNYLEKYDYVFINDDIEKTALRVWALMSGILVPGDDFNADMFHLE